MLVGFLNGATSLIRQGLNNCQGGLGASRGCATDAYLPRTDGYLNWRPVEPTVNATIDGLDLLLTGGRLQNHSKAILRQVYMDSLAQTGSTERAVQTAQASAPERDTATSLAPPQHERLTPPLLCRAPQEIMMATSEFSTVNDNALRIVPRTPPTPVPYQNRSYRALIVLYFGGGADTFNMLTPHSHCHNASGPHDLFAEYTTTRKNAALTHSQLFTINASNSTMRQPCELLGLHPSMPFLKRSYDAGEAAFEANIGALVVPTTKAQIRAKTARLPISLFAHNVQTTAAFTIHAQNTQEASGVAGRILATLDREGSYRTDAWSINGQKRLLAGTRPPWILDKTAGIVAWQRQGALGSYMQRLHTNESNSPFSELVGDRMSDTIYSSQYMGTLLDTAPIATTFPHYDDTYQVNHDLSKQLEQVAKVIYTRDAREVERDIFYVQSNGYDTHNEVINALLKNYHLVDTALEAFASEMKLQGLWNNIVIQAASEFGRTMVGNGRGTDHGWGGNMFTLGGKVRGRRVHGVFPNDLRMDSDTMYTGSSGRVIPTTGWEAVWKPLAEWMGVSPSGMATILPNRDNFPAEQLITKEQMFVEDEDIDLLRTSG